MNKLVEYMVEHHHPGGNAYKVVSVSTILEAGFSVEEIHEMAIQAYTEKHLMISRIRVKGNRWGFDSMIPGDIDYMAVTGEGIEWYRTNRNETHD